MNEKRLNKQIKKLKKHAKTQKNETKNKNSSYCNIIYIML